MAVGANVPYNPTAEVTPLQEAATPERTVRATPESFGAQIGAGMESTGQKGEQAAVQWAGLKAETEANQHELDYITQQGNLKAKYTQYEGLQAAAMRPQYEQESLALQKQYRESLSPIAAKLFDATTRRTLANDISEYAGYAAKEVKGANLASNNALADNTINSAGNLPTVQDDTRFGGLIGTLVYSVNGVADIKGWSSAATGRDPSTGKLTFGDDPQSQIVKAQYEEYLGEKESKLFLTAGKTIADNQGATAAADFFQKHWDMMPDKAKVEANQYIAPKMKNEIISGNVANMSAGVDADFNKQFLAKVPSSPTELADTQKDVLGVIRKNEGIGYSKDSKGEVINGINSLAYPKEFAEAKALLPKGQQAVNDYADQFYQKNIIEKYGIKDLPTNTQAIVADGLVNHSHEFGQQLLAAAKGGATPQQLIDLRRAEYQHLADSDAGKPADQQQGYAKSLKGWNARLDSFDLSPGLHGAPQPEYPNKADYLREHYQQYVDNARNAYLQKYPDDYYGAQIQSQRAISEINHQVAIEDGKLKGDRDVVSNAIFGSLTKGNPPATYEQLRALPNMAPVLDRVMREQGKFFGDIDTMIGKASHQEGTINSPNAYSTILQSMEATDPSAAESHLHSLFARSDQTGISYKDYKDGMKSQPGSIDTYHFNKEFLEPNMKAIAMAGGNIDGEGERRAVQWYNDVLKAKDEKTQAKVAETDMLNSESKDYLGGTMGKYMPSRADQIKNLAAKTKPADRAFDYGAIDKGQRYTAPDGSIRIKQ